MLKVSQTKNYWLVENSADIETVISKLTDRTIVAFDTETSGLNVRKDKIIGYSISVDEGAGYYVPIFSWNGKELVPHKIAGTKKLLDILSDKKLVMHNASFDTRITINYAEVDLLSNLHADTMLMMHTLNEEGPFGLKEIAIEKAEQLGMSSEDVANQEQLELQENVIKKGGVWKQKQKDIYMADLLVLAKYACADTDLTLRLYNLFSKELKQQELHNFFYQDEVMPVYKTVTVPMEHNGVYLDMAKLLKYNEEITQTLAELTTKVTEQILNTPEGDDFLMLRCEEEVGRKVSGGFAQAIAEYYDLPLPKNEKGKYSITAKTVKSLAEGPGKEALTNKDTKHIPEIIIKDIQVKKLQKDGEILNIGSKNQLGRIVFDILGIEPLGRTPKGSPQFDEDMIEHLADKHNIPWAKELRVFNKLTKIKTSYYDRFLEQNEDGIFYPSFKQHGTTSGRYGSDMQQLSRPLEDDADDLRVVKFVNTLRELIIPKPGYVFIDDDYESLEPRVFCDDANEKDLIEIFELGEDFYSKVAILTEGLEGVSANKKAENYLKTLHPQVRQDAKEYALGIRYGMKEVKLSYVLNIEKEAALEKIEKYFKAFPNLKTAMDNYLEQAKTKGIVRSKYGRIRHLPIAKRIYDRYGDDILDFKKLGQLSKKHYVAYDVLKSVRKEYNNLLNNALNFPIQAAATSIVNRAMAAMTKKFNEQGLDAWVSLQIHDQIVVSSRKDVKDQVAKIVQDCMENTNKLSVKLIAKPEFAMNLREGH